MNLHPPPNPRQRLAFLVDRIGLTGTVRALAEVCAERAERSTEAGSHRRAALWGRATAELLRLVFRLPEELAGGDGGED